MTSSEPSECSQCGGPLSYRPIRDYPVVLQIAFALSFLLFLIFANDIQHNRTLIWAWSSFQILIGIFLVRARLKARKRVLRCVRCSAALR